MTDPGSEAHRLASGTVYSYASWLTALALIGDRPDRDELIRIVHEAAVCTGKTPVTVARILLGDGEAAPGAIAAYASFRQSARGLATAGGVSADRLPALAAGVLGLARDDEAGS